MAAARKHRAPLVACITNTNKTLGKRTGHLQKIINVKHKKPLRNNLSLYNYFITASYAALAIQVVMLFVYSGSPPLRYSTNKVKDD